jgi:hypothetical protein
MSIAHMLMQLEERVAHHRERQTFHAEQEMLHRIALQQDGARSRP